MTNQTDSELIASLTGFAPGPWGVLGWSKDMIITGNSHLVTDAEGFPSALVPAWDDLQWGEFDGRDEAMVNAALIAAAPDLHRIASEQAAEIERLRGALGALVAMSDDHGPFGGEIYQDKIDRAWDAARNALKGGAKS